MIYNLEPDFQCKDKLYATWGGMTFCKRVDNEKDEWVRVSREDFEAAAEESVIEAIHNNG